MRPMKRIMAVIFIWMLVCTTVWGAQKFSLAASQSYKMKTAYEIANTGRNAAVDIKVKVLIGAKDSSPYQKNISWKVTPSPKSTYTDSFGNMFAEIRIDRMSGGEKKSIIIEKTVQNSAISYEKSIYSLKGDYTLFKKQGDNLQYLEAGDKIESDALEIKAKAKSFNTKQPTVKLAQDIYDFVNLHIQYNTSSAYANKGALSALKTGKGVCDEYACLFTALCRASGIPARVVTGYWPDKTLKKNQWSNVADDRHAWAEFYLPSVGWVPVEPTFSYTLDGKRVPNHNYFARIGSGDRHFIDGYNGNQEGNNISVSYAYYKKTSLSVKSAGEWMMGAE